LRRVAMAFTVATAGMTATVGTAQAATLSINPVQACYISGETAIATGAGFTPSGQVTATFAGNSGVFNVDAAGNSEPLKLTFPGAKGIETETLAETDTANPALTASLQMLVTNRHVDVNPTHAAAGKKLRIKGYGLTGGPKVYMHIRGPHHYRSDTKIAKAKGPCGTFKTRRKIVSSGAAPGAYKVRFDHKKTYSKKTKPQTGGTLTITRTFHAVGARAAAFGWSAD
jgi:hypothetical protein